MSDPDKVDEALEYYGGADSRGGILAAEVERWRELHGADDPGDGIVINLDRTSAAFRLCRERLDEIRTKDREIERLREADPFAPLQAWLGEDKSRSVQVYRDDGKGCSPWTCELSVNNKPVVTVHEYADGDWQGPAFTIQKALREFAAEATPA